MTLDQRTEWLEADGIGGFASGTVSGLRTRRCHALLLSATTPPTGRRVLVNGLDAWLTTSAGQFALSTQRYQPDVLHPYGYRRVASFATEPWPTWEFDIPDGVRMSQEVIGVAIASSPCAGCAPRPDGSPRRASGPTVMDCSAPASLACN